MSTPNVGDNGDPCLVCGSTKVDLRFPATFQGSVDDAVNYFLANRKSTAHADIVQCRNCGFLFTSPRFDSEEYDSIYGAIAHGETTNASLQSANSVRCRRLARLVTQFADPRAPFLDFGCGDGTFLREFRNPEGRGFEVGSPSRQMAGAHEIIVGDWAKTAGSQLVPEGSLDYLTAFDVLEHLPRIDEDLALIRKTLRYGGLFFVSVPNASSTIARLMGKRWNMLLLEHLWYFSPSGLERFLARHGFELVDTRSVPYDAPVGHIITRLAQSFQMFFLPKFGPLERLVLPTPAGIMFGVYRAV